MPRGDCLTELGHPLKHVSDWPDDRHKQNKVKFLSQVRAYF